MRQSGESRQQQQKSHLPPKRDPPRPANHRPPERAEISCFELVGNSALPPLA